jgi:hypothetical protein
MPLIMLSVGGPFWYPTYTWQELLWTDDGSYDFWYFCWNVTNLDAPESRTQVDYELASATNGEPWVNLGNYAHYIKKFVLDNVCAGVSVNSSDCAGTQDISFWSAD